MANRVRTLVPPALMGVLFLVGWQGLVWWQDIPEYILPGPWLVAETLWRDGRSLLDSLVVTLIVTGAALVAAIIIGGAIAILFAQFRWLEVSLFPYAVILQVTPIVSIAPLLVIWLKYGFLSSLVCAWLVAFFPVIANTTLGLKSADRNLVDLFRLYGASRWQTLRYLRLPAALPSFLAGVRISGGLALIGAVVAEFVLGTGGPETGLATRILEAENRLEMPRLFAALVLLSLTGIAMFAGLSLMTRLLIGHWHESALPPED